MAGTVPYYNDFLGETCVREADLESAWREGFKGTRPPPVCIERPCDAALSRESYARNILGRAATDQEWSGYQDRRTEICSSDSPDEYAGLEPVQAPLTPEVTRRVSDGFVDLFPGISVTSVAATTPGYGSRQVDRPDGDRDRSDPFEVYTPGGRLPGGGSSSGGSGGISDRTIIDGGTGGGGGGGSDSPPPPVAPVPVPPTALAMASALAMTALLRRRRRG
ncbi:hypothetical protein [Mangrovicoccus algicola]|uniref:Uncharacterized protein n=1 Tax=Mangrovicoccus algicola TaxID=2771008 RepID=A0A8J6YXG9_9RHOB|nr:hypothetical protein [Mangrovicoccus algicola]MBE3637686.1 hypothetical protein [Mangrovicoccus algicola]